MPVLLLILFLMLPVTAMAAPEAKCADPAVFACDNFEDRAPGSADDLQTSKGGKTIPWSMSGSAESSRSVRASA